MSRYVKDTNDNWQLSSGMPQIDDELDATSENPVQNKAIVEGISPILNVLGAKNLLPNTATTQTVGDVTFTVNSDGSVTANGTAASGASNPYIKLTENFTVPRSGQYIVSGNPVAGNVSSGDWTTDIYLSDKTSGISHDFSSLGDEQYYFDSTHVYRISTYVKAGATVSNVRFYPMIRPASIQDGTYVPYAMTNRELTDITNRLLVDSRDSSNTDFTVQLKPNDSYLVAFGNPANNPTYSTIAFIFTGSDTATIVPVVTHTAITYTVSSSLLLSVHRGIYAQGVVIKLNR